MDSFSGLAKDLPCFETWLIRRLKDGLSDPRCPESIFASARRPAAAYRPILEPPLGKRLPGLFPIPLESGAVDCQGTAPGNVAARYREVRVAAS